MSIFDVIARYGVVPVISIENEWDALPWANVLIAAGLPSAKIILRTDCESGRDGSVKMRNIKKYQTGGTRSKMELSIPLPQTPEGRVYRYSPNEDAHPRHFDFGERVAEISDYETRVRIHNQ